MVIKATYTACEKLKKIMNLKEESAKKMVRRACIWGTNIMDLPSRERAYFEDLVDTKHKTAYVYMNCCFIVADGYCVTVIKNPSWVGNKAKYMGKTWVKNPKKYAKFCDGSSYDENEHCA